MSGVLSAQGEVRSLCPFCFNTQDRDDETCCPEWAATGTEAFEPEPAVAAFAPAPRLDWVSRSLVMMVASSIVATCISFGMQSRFVPDRVAFAAAPIRASVMPAASKPERPSVAAEVAVASLAPVVPPAPPELVGPLRPESKPVRAEVTADDLGKWQHLRRGMSRTAVRILFGYPKWVDRRSTPRTEYWLYEGERVGDGAWIAFLDNEGPVASWRRP